MKEYYEVCHCGKRKVIVEKSKAFSHADALAKLGYSVKVYLLRKDLISEVRVILWSSDSNYLTQLVKQFLEKGEKK